MQAQSLAKINNIPSLQGSFTRSYLCGSPKDICDFCSLESAHRLDHKVDSFQNSTSGKKKHTPYNWKLGHLWYKFALFYHLIFLILHKNISCSLVKFPQIHARYRKQAICKVILKQFKL